MSDVTKPGTPRWILLATGLVGLVAAVLVAATKYYELHKARVEALRAQTTPVDRPNQSSDSKGVPAAEGDSKPAPPNNDKSNVREGKAAAPVASLVGRWDNVTSKGWRMEFLATGEALNIDPTGAVDTRGTWKDEGNGKFSARLGPDREWEWAVEVQGNSMSVEARLGGTRHSRSTFSRNQQR